MQFLKTLATAAILSAGAISAQAATVTVDFSGDAPGSVPNGFTSSAVRRIVSFTDSIRQRPAGRSTTDLRAIGNGLGVYYDDASTLVMNFTQAVTNLALSVRKR